MKILSDEEIEQRLYKFTKDNPNMQWDSIVSFRDMCQAQLDADMEERLDAVCPNRGSDVVGFHYQACPRCLGTGKIQKAKDRPEGGD